VSTIASDSSREIGIIANSIGRGVLTSGPGFRIAPEVLCKLARLAGADGVYTGPFFGSINTELHAERFHTALNGPYHRECARKPAAAVMSGGLGLPEIIQNEKLYAGDLFLSMGRDFVRPIDAGIPAAVVLDCIRSVWNAVRDHGIDAGRDVVSQLSERDTTYGECLVAIRAEAAVSR
jgi:ribulose 1,5-bisphosphate carboxylase large subunit-like protein